MEKSLLKKVREGKGNVKQEKCRGGFEVRVRVRVVAVDGGGGGMKKVVGWMGWVFEEDGEFLLGLLSCWNIFWEGLK